MRGFVSSVCDVNHSLSCIAGSRVSKNSGQFSSRPSGRMRSALAPFGTEHKKDSVVTDPQPRVRVSTIVATDPADAFEVFTRETALWWRRDPRFRMSSSVPSILRFETGLGSGRVFEEFPGGKRSEIGRILGWEPGERLIFEWQSPHFDPSARTEVEVTFAPVTDGTEVTLEHRGWQRHRFSAAFGDLVALWWGDLFTAYRFELRKKVM